MVEQRATPTESRLSQAIVQMHHSRQTLKKFTHKDQAIDDQLNQLQEQARSLKTMRKLNRGQHNQWLPGVYERSILPYLKAWNLKFTEDMQTRLPRELRDMIYDSLWDRETRLAASLLNDMARGAYSQDEDTLLYLYDYHHLPHFLSLQYVGPKIALEVAEALYKSYVGAGFILWSPSWIHRVLTTDCFYVGLTPKDILRDLSIHCKIDSYRTPRVQHAMTKNCRHTAVDKAYIDRKLLKKEFNELLSIKNNSNFKLHILLLQRYIRINVIAEVVNVLREVRAAFIAEGAEVNIVWTYRGN
ncbi:hypothetical protein CC86DRAFT_409650 [Ophiobolus disseminans]|uniref:Uncharacterized protein n=1 Tax=Ophiobolus disseminans TaxID=1469910 RepID=A0A6A6ZR10_9PLEO|nr:hypothetical protein CC86DRAFT_409650 [Ophiobolus disseminans]